MLGCVCVSVVAARNGLMCQGGRGRVHDGDAVVGVQSANLVEPQLVPVRVAQRTVDPHVVVRLFGGWGFGGWGLGVGGWGLGVEVLGLSRTFIAAPTAISAI